MLSAIVAQTELKLPDRLLEVLDILIARRFKPTDAEVLDAILSALKSGDDADLKSALKNTALYQQLTSEWEEVKTQLVDRIPEKLKPLTYKLSALDDPAEWPLLATNKAVPASPYFKITAQGKLALSAVATGSFEPPRADGENPSADERILIITATGQVGLGASGSYNAPWGGATLGAAAEASASLRVLSRKPADARLGSALVSLGLGGYEWWDIESGRSAYANGLRRVSLLAKGSLKVSAGLKAGTSSVFEYAGGALASSISVKANIGASITAEASLKGSYVLHVDYESDGDVIVSVHRNHEENRSLALKLGAEVSIKGLAEQSDQLLEKILPSAQPILDLLDKYKDPIGLLKEDLAKQIKDELKDTGQLGKYAEGLTSVLLGQSDAKKFASSVAESLAQRLTDRWESELLDALAAGQGAIDVAAARAAGSLPQWFPHTASQDVQAKLNAILKDRLDSLSTRIDQRIAQQIDKAKNAGGTKLADLLAPLQLIGERTNDVQAKVTAATANATAPIRKFIAEYDKLRGRVKNALEKTASEKLAVSITSSMTRTDVEESLLTCRIFAVNDDVKAFFQSLFIGQVDLSRIVDTQGKPKSGVSDVRGKLTKTIVEARNTSLAVNLFGFKFSHEALILSKVVVERDISGRILIARSSGTFAETTKAFDYIKTSRIDFGFGAGTGEMSTVPEITTAYTLKEEEADPQDLLSVMQSLVDVGLLSKGGLGSVKEQFDLLGIRGGKKLRDLDLALKLSFSPSDWDKWNRHDDPSLRRIFADAYYEAGCTAPPEWKFQEAISVLATTVGASGREAFWWLADNKRSNSSATNALEKAFGDAGIPASTKTSSLWRGARIAIRSTVAVNNLVRARQTWRDLLTLALDPAAQNEANFADRLRHLSKRLAEEFSYGSTSSMTFAGNEDFIPTLTAGFMIGMLRAADRSTHLVPVKVSFGSSSDRQDLIVI